jgi:hypothetical protein
MPREKVKIKSKKFKVRLRYFEFSKKCWFTLKGKVFFEEKDCFNERIDKWFNWK